MAQRWTLEIKVGAFVVLGLGLFVFFLFAIGDFSTAFQPGYSLEVVFDSANGITDGAPVQYAGVEVGKVQSLRLGAWKEGSPPQVKLVIHLPNRVEVRSDDKATISTFGLLGEKYLSISPGPGSGQVLGPNSLLVGQPPVSTEQIMERSNDVLTEFERTLEGLNSLVADPESHVYLKEILVEARDASRNWKTLGERLNIAMSRVESGEGSIGHLLYDDELYLRVAAFVDDLRAHPWKLLQRPKSQKQ